MPINDVLVFKPLTGKPNMVPWKKFQLMCNPIGKASLPVRTIPNPSKKPDMVRLRTDANELFGLKR